MYHADLFIHSFPVESPTTFYEALMLDSSKVITFKPLGISWAGVKEPEIFDNIVCNTTSELVERAISILNRDCHEYFVAIEKLKLEIINNCCKAGWNKLLKGILQKVNKHKVFLDFNPKFAIQDYGKFIFLLVKK